MPVTPLPTPPNRALPNDTFDDVADAFFSALPVFATELNAMGAFGATSLSTTQTATTVTINSDTGADAVISAADGTNAGVMPASAFTKLATIAPGAMVGGVQTAGDFLASQAKVNGLVSNGSAQEGTNANFTQFLFDNQIPPPNTVGYFKRIGTAGILQSVDFMPVDINLIYLGSVNMRQRLRSVNTAFYAGIAQYDTDNNLILQYHHRYVSGTMTTLSAPLSVGDTTVSLASTSGWTNAGTSTANTGISLYGYKNSIGYTYDSNTNPYTRTVFRSDAAKVWGDGAVGLSSITLATAFSVANPAAGSGGVWPAGTVVSNTTGSSSHNYFLANNIKELTTNWRFFRGYVGGGVNTSGQSDETRFAAGIAKCKLLYICNLSGTSTDETNITNINFTPTSLTRALAGLPV